MGTTIHLAISKNACVNFKLFPSENQDSKSIKELWKEWSFEKIKYVVADKGYDSMEIRDHIRKQGATPVIPYKGIW